jgi:hypothetical protein
MAREEERETTTTARTAARKEATSPPSKDDGELAEHMFNATSWTIDRTLGRRRGRNSGKTK